MQSDLVDDFRSELRPRLYEVLKYLGDQSDPMAFSWYVDLMAQLDSATCEEDLLMFSVELSKAAFLGFQYDETAWRLIDDLLAHAQQLAHTLSAAGSDYH